MKMHFEKTDISTILCGVGLGISLLFLGLAPLGNWLYLIAKLQHSSREIAHATFVLIVCGVLGFGGIAPSIVAKIINKKSKWPIINIVMITLTTIADSLLTWGVVALMQHYNR